jgi:acyl-CoA thioesterase-1
MDDKGQTRENAPASVNGSSSATTVNTSGPTVLFFGTSLTAGYGLQPEQAFPAALAKKAAQAGLPINVVNAGLSGETSAGALRRIDWALKTPAQVIVIETGANDALRGLSVEAARSNVEQIVAKTKKAQPNAKILLVEMLAPPNLGRSYTEGFKQIYSSVAKQEKVTLVPFFLDGVAGRPELNQADGVHPNAAGARLVADNVWRVLKPVIAGLKQQ